LRGTAHEYMELYAQYGLYALFEIDHVGRLRILVFLADVNVTADIIGFRTPSFDRETRR